MHELYSYILKFMKGDHNVSFISKSQFLEISIVVSETTLCPTPTIAYNIDVSNSAFGVISIERWQYTITLKNYFLYILSCVLK